jgi:hypothetical protein
VLKINKSNFQSSKRTIMTNPNFEFLLNDPTIKFTIILGSGFHRQALGSNSILSNWEKLLKEQDPELALTGFYPLDFEQLIVRRTGNQKDEESRQKAAGEMENRISEEICFDLQCAQEKALKFNKKRYPTGIFNPIKVSDVVSLNFDTTAETLCCKEAKQKESKLEYSNFESKENGNFEIPFWEVGFKKEDKIRFWYPHGSIHDKDTITLGTREYSKRFETIERLRKHSKSDKENKPTSWYHQITHNPVLILGADMSKDEWDIWFVLVNRERNFAKNENQQYKHPIFQMRECECKNDAQHQWFEPLFTGITFDQQWEKLEELFKTL